MNTLAERLAHILKERGKTAADLARATGKTESAVSQWLSGETKSMRSDSLMAACALLSCNPQWLASGKGPIEGPILGTTYTIIPGEASGGSSSNQAKALMGRAVTAINLIEYVYPAEFSIPLLSWVRAGAFCEAPGSFTKDDAEELLPRPLFRTGPNTFALRVVGDSMDVPDGYREGEIVYIDPDVEPTPGRDVLAKADNKMTLKRYKVDEYGPYLLQLNGSKIIRPTEWTVCGVVVFSGQRR